MADFLAEKRSEIDGRLEELRPLVAEYERLQAAEEALSSIPPSSTPTEPQPRHGGRKPGSSKTSTARSGKRGRPKGSGTRGAEALAFVRAKPGITIPEIAEKMGIKQNYLYRVLPGLAEDGLVRKKDRGWHPKGSGSAS